MDMVRAKIQLEIVFFRIPLIFIAVYNTAKKKYLYVAAVFCHLFVYIFNIFFNKGI